MIYFSYPMLLWLFLPKSYLKILYYKILPFCSRYEKRMSKGHVNNLKSFLKSSTKKLTFVNFVCKLLWLWYNHSYPLPFYSIFYPVSIWHSTKCIMINSYTNEKWLYNFNLAKLILQIKANDEGEIDEHKEKDSNFI